MISILNIAEQCKSILGKGNIQELIQASKNALASYVKAQWYAGKQDGVNEVNGAFIYTFKNNLPTLDEDLEQYYITVPSSVLDLPHDYGINLVSWQKGQDKPFVRMAASQSSMFAGLKSEGMAGSQTYSTEGNRMYFPKMKEIDVKVKGETRPVLIKLAIGFDNIDVDEQLNISAAAQNEVVNIVLDKYQIKEDNIDKSIT